IDEDRTLELSEALARHSLVYPDSTELGPRSRMLETVREYVAERLAARPDAVDVGHRHAGYYRDLAEQADMPLRAPGQNERVGRLQGGGGQLAAPAAPGPGHRPAPPPPLFRGPWP